MVSDPFQPHGLQHSWLPWSITNSQNLLKLMSIELVMPSNHIVLCCPLLLPSIFPGIRGFPMSWFFASGGQSFGTSALASVLPMNVQDWFPLVLTGLISLQSKIFISKSQSFTDFSILNISKKLQCDPCHGLEPRDDPLWLTDCQVH